MNTTDPQALDHLGGLTAEEFIEHYWQKKPLLIRSAFTDTETWVDADTLAGLALEEDVESRIVSGHADLGKDAWQLQLGPFDESIFSQLGQKNWTLLVQAVDHYLPDMAQLMPWFDFIPAWRQDDIMASYSVPGGSVGPHFDQYDVFLLQSSGTKTWHVGDVCDEDSTLLKNCPLSILEQFNSQQSWTLEPGDMLYVPSNKSHFGVADSEGITLSVGFRSPSTQEFLDHFVGLCASDFGNKIHYRDADLIQQKNNGWINPQAINKFQGLLKELIEDEQRVALTLAQLASQPKYPSVHPTSGSGSTLDNETPTPLKEIIHQNLADRLIRDENTRINYLGSEAKPERFFINGEIIDYPKEPRASELVLLLAHQRIIELTELTPFLQNNALLQWLEGLVNSGHFYFEDTE